MSKEFTLDKVGQTELQAIQPVHGDLEDAVKGLSTSAAPQAQDGNAMQPMGQAEIIDNTGSWGQQVGNANYAYRREGFEATENMVHVDPETGNHEELNNYEADLTDAGAVNNPEAGQYKKDTYVTKTPVEKHGAGHPSFGELVEANPAGQQANELQGTLQMPNLKNELEPTLFINNSVYQEDIHQGNLDNCYFLSALLQVIHYEPAKIMNMMHLMGDKVVTSFYHKGTDGHWVPTMIQTDFSCIKRNFSGGPNINTMNMMGSRARIDFDPKRSVWTSSISEDTLKISKADYYEAALWVNCIEQAFAAFAMKYGQAGDGLVKNAERFENINFGLSCDCLPLFYGDDAEVKKPIMTVSNNEGDALVADNRILFRELVNLAHAQDGHSETDVHMMAGTPALEAARRLYNKSTKMINLLSTSGATILPNTMQAVEGIQFCAQQYYNKMYMGDPMGARNYCQALDSYSRTLENDPAVATVAGSDYQLYREAIGMVANLRPSEAGATDGNLFLYNTHAYNVDHVNLVGRDGSPLNQADLATVMRNVDIKASTVCLQNPHGANVPNIHEEQYVDKDRGEFTISLESFMSAVGEITIANTQNRRDN